MDMKCMPSHVAIIMDGNGRWAKQRGMERTFGHQAGAETVHQIVEEAARLGIKYLTLYTFSTENWNRPTEEITALMGLLFEHIEEETFMKNNVSFKVIGDIDELTEAARQIAADVNDGKLKLSDIDSNTIQQHLATKDMPDVDLLIRTGGEQRLSNYLLWQCAYAELYFCDTYWPDFKEQELRTAIADYQNRERRYGKTSEQLKSDD